MKKKVKITASIAHLQAQQAYQKLMSGQIPNINNYEVLELFLDICEFNDVKVIGFREDVKSVELSMDEMRIAMLNNIDIRPKS